MNSAIRPGRGGGFGGERGLGVPPGLGAWTGAPLPSRLLTFGWVPIQASSGAHGWAPPPPPSPRAPAGPWPLQPGDGSGSPRSSMPGSDARKLCAAPAPGRKQGRAHEGSASPPPPRRLPAGGLRKGRKVRSAPPSHKGSWNGREALSFCSAFIHIWADSRVKKLPCVGAVCSSVEKAGSTEKASLPPAWGPGLQLLGTGKASFRVVLA